MKPVHKPTGRQQWKHASALTKTNPNIEHVILKSSRASVATKVKEVRDKDAAQLQKLTGTHAKTRHDSLIPRSFYGRHADELRKDFKFRKHVRSVVTLKKITAAFAGGLLKKNSAPGTESAQEAEGEKNGPSPDEIDAGDEGDPNKQKRVTWPPKRDFTDKKPCVWLKGNEGRKMFKVELAVVERNEEILKLVEQHAEVLKFPGCTIALQLKRVSEDMLTDILEYSRLYKEAPKVPEFADETNPMDGVAHETLGHLTPFDWHFLTKERMKHDYVLKFLQVAQECGNKEGCLMAANLLACEMKGLDLKQLRKVMHAKSDVTRKDWEQISYENKFLIASDSDSDPEHDVGMVYNDLIINNVYDQLDLQERHKLYASQLDKHDAGGGSGDVAGGREGDSDDDGGDRVITAEPKPIEVKTQVAGGENA